MKKSSVFVPSLHSFIQRNGIQNEAKTTKTLRMLAEDKAASLNYDEKRILLPNSVRSTFLMVFSPDGKKVGSTHGDHKIYISSVKTGKIIRTLEGHPRTPWSLAFHPTLCNILASGCLAGEVRVWDLKSGACEIWVNSHGSVIASLSFHPVDYVILIATYNELHFWDWRQSHEPFLTLTTPSEKEKVRFVKFDSTGTKIITGISNIPPIRSSASHISHTTASLLAQRSPESGPNFDSNSLSPQSNFTSTSASLALRRSNLLSRVMSMYRHLEGLEENRANSGYSAFETNASGEVDELNSILETSSATERILERFRNATQIEQEPRETDLLSPSSTFSRFEQARDIANAVTLANRHIALSSPFSSDISNFDYSTNLMSTFRRLHSLCTRLAQLMQDQQTGDQTEPSSSAATSTTSTTSSLSSLLERLQQSLQNMSTAALSTAIAHEHIQQVRQRVAEIFERLVNVSGYRARLSNLRDQIYEVAERIATGSEPEFGTQRWDLLHCLWLVDMSIHLTRQMQRILAADYRLTQLTLTNPTSLTTSSSGSSNSDENERSSTSSTSGAETRGEPAQKRPRNTSSDRDIRTRTSHSSSPERREPVPSTSSGITRPRYEYNRWLVRNRAGSNSTNSSDNNNANKSCFNIPTVRISGPETNEENESRSPRIRPRSPPLPEIHQVLNSSLSERFNVPIYGSQSSLNNPGIPSQHIWFSGGPLSSVSGFSDLRLIGGGGNFNYRIQCWNFSRYELPNLKDAQANLVVPKCRIHNDASVDISTSGDLLACLVPVDSSPSVNLCIFSLEKETFAQCFYVWTFGANAISVSLSPLSRYVVVGLTSPRTSQIYVYPPSSEPVTIAQVFKLSGHSKSTIPSFQHIRNIEVPRGDDVFNLNSICWLPNSGEGLIYGTNKGHLVICRPSSNESNRSPGFSRRSTTGTQTYPQRTGTLSIGTQTTDAIPLSQPLETLVERVENSSDSD
ncbi:activating molecule in BECN1-regulated autophagy protein 1-like protein [Dinothrombium tinctorium]|uniref:Activating molecule in BECN1-regulated autophagy protein 1-like protein n=1 Tax=Dinothrombium tinctorium TaxID=1965070 RepID=A0A3S3P5U7_9ACAR|nr:activating molecule in BECN1-regulated autophagy protein 1-like protein [Dinothrombium tinctorium]